MRKLIAVICTVGVMAACGGGSTVSGPTPEQPTASVTTPTQATPAPAPVPVPEPTTGPSFEGYITNNAGWFVRNLATTPSRIVAYTTNFDNQSVPTASKPAVVINTSDTYEGSFGATCVQVDLTYGNAGDAPFLAGFIDDKGKVVRSIDQGIRDRCAPKCEPKFTTREAVAYEGEGCSRVKITTTYTLNSCSKEETSVVVRKSDPVPVYRTDSYFSVDYLSNTGDHYAITDSSLVAVGNLLGIWKSNLHLTSGNHSNYQYPHAADGSKLTLYYLIEKIDSAKATCPVGPEAAWHGNVSFKCERVNTCEQGPQ